MEVIELVKALQPYGYIDSITIGKKKFQFCEEYKYGAIYGYWNGETREDEFIRTVESDDAPAMTSVNDCDVLSIIPSGNNYLDVTLMDGKDRIFTAEEVKYQEEEVEDSRLEITIYSVGGAWYGYKMYYRGKTWESDLQESQLTLDDIETIINDNLNEDFYIDTQDNEIKIH